MHSPSRPSPVRRPRPARGSGIIAVLIFTTMMMLIAGSLLSWSTNERKLSYRSSSWLEARNAAEAVTEYACYQVAQAFNTRQNPTFGNGGSVTISFPSTLAATVFANSKVDLSSIEVKAGTVTQV